MNGRKMSLLGMIFLLFTQLWSGSVLGLDNSSTTIGETTKSMSVKANEAMHAAATRVKTEANLSEWAAIGLVKAGHLVPDTYITSVRNLLKEDRFFQRVTDIERVALALGVLGYDPSQFEGNNLIAQIANHERMLNQGINGPVYALLVLGSSSYTLPPNSLWTEISLVNHITERQNIDGGWSLTDGGNSSVDVTAMTLTALSTYKGALEVDAAIAHGLSWLQSVQLSSGGFSDHGDNLESAAQVVIALSALEIDAATFTNASEESTENVLSHLLKFQLPSGSFEHRLGMGANAMSTEQALLALAAYNSYLNKAGSIYKAAALQKLVSVKVEGIEHSLMSGYVSASTALSALEQLAQHHNIPLTLVETSFGTYVSAIGEMGEGAFGGFDGWAFNVKRDENWTFPAVGMADYELKLGDQVFIYYTDYNTQMIDAIILDPLQPKVGESFTVQVMKSKWDWSEGSTILSPAAGVQVQIGSIAVMTNEDGIAAFPGKENAGILQLEVTSYAPDTIPAIVRHRQSISIQPAKVTATITVEGLTNTIKTGQVHARNGSEGLIQLLETHDISYHLQEYSFGHYIDVIDGQESGSLGGFDGWRYVVKRGNQWIHPSVSIDNFSLETNDHLYYYYHDDGTKLVASIEFEPVQPRMDEPFAVVVKQAEWQWETSSELVSAAGGVQVSIGDVTITTDEQGQAYFSTGVSQGMHTITISGHREGLAPSVVRMEQLLSVYADSNEVADWAEKEVQKALNLGLMQGVSLQQTIFAPQRSMTKAEYLTLLLRLISEQPASEFISYFDDVRSSDWFAGVVTRAVQLGIIHTEEANFNPNAALKREELARMTVKALKLDMQIVETGLIDLHLADPSTLPYINTVFANGILLGSTSGNFMPDTAVSREMAAMIGVRIFEKN